ncbi:putative leucine-rich repeat-containing protein DDB_G0290503 isoform X2 [Macrobrachium rosenbergii]|uniref:putative leucine-rich repeat-containing protein DDB_G0290503 isoform X2 n=1 Tax=Macrobrachium rosenbergii TaxID=79674 RepID=UPI0034D3EE05
MLRETYPSTKLAVTATNDSSAGGEEDIHQDLLEAESCAKISKSDKDLQRVRPTTPIQLVTEKEIALSQLQELEVAIKVRKGSKVDGRKVRWIEYRARKAEEERNNNSSNKTKSKSRKSKSVENDENVLSVNNNNNNSENTESMKGEVINTPLVLESMKLQFLQGTENIEGPVTNGSNSDSGLHKSPDATQKRKSVRTRRSQSTPKENKEIKSSPKSVTRGTQKSKSKVGTDIDEEADAKSLSSLKKLPPKDTTVNGTSEILTKIENVPTEDVPIITTPAIMSSFKVRSPATSPGISEVLPSCIRPVYKSVTKGLREVRKTENGVEVEAVKSEIGAVTSSGGTESKFENDLKCMTVTPPPVFWNPPLRARSADNVSVTRKKSVTPKKVKTPLSKSVEKIDSEADSITNGHHDLEIESHKEDVIEKDESHLSTEENLETPKKKSPQNSDEEVVKRKRGRPPKRKLNLVEADDRKVSPDGKSSKKVETVIADVHNTMNGEPQTVIPVSRPVLRGKKISVVKRLVKWSQEDVSPDVDSSGIIYVKTSVKKGMSSESLGKGKEKSSRADAKKKVTGTKKKGSGVSLDDSGISSTSSASVNNQTQTTQKCKSTKSAKGVRLGALSPGKSVEDTKNTTVKANPQDKEDTDVSDNEQKDKHVSKAEKSLAGRVIRRSEHGKSPEHTNQPLNKNLSAKNDIISSKENSAPKTSSTGKEASQKPSNAVRNSSGRSSSLENVNAFKDDAKTVDDDGIHKVKPKYGREGTNLRKSSSAITGNSDSQMSIVEESPKRSQKLGVTIPASGRSKNIPVSSISPNKGKQVETTSKIDQEKEKSSPLGDSEDKELQGPKKTVKGKAKMRNKEGNISVHRDAMEEDKVLSTRRVPKKTTLMEISKVGPEKSSDNKMSMSFPDGVEEAPETKMEVTPLDEVSGHSTAGDGPTTELGKGWQASVKQGKSQKELGLLETKKTKNDESPEIIMSKGVTNVLQSDKQTIELKKHELPVTKKTQEAKENLQKKNSGNDQEEDSISSEILLSDPNGQLTDKKLLEKVNIYNEKQSTRTVKEVSGSTTQSVEGRLKDDIPLENKLIEKIELDEAVTSGEAKETAEHLNEEQSKGVETADVKVNQENVAEGTLFQNLEQKQIDTEQLQLKSQCELKTEIEEFIGTEEVENAQVSSSCQVTSVNRAPVLSPQHLAVLGEHPLRTSEVECEEIGFNNCHALEKTSLNDSKKSVEPILKTMGILREEGGDNSESTKESSLGNIDRRKGIGSTDYHNLESDQRTSLNDLNAAMYSVESSVDAGKEMEPKSNVPELSTTVFYAKNKNKASFLPTSKSDSQDPEVSLAKDVSDKKVLIAEEIMVEDSNLVKSKDNQNEKSIVNVTDQACEMQSPLLSKSKEKVPRILKQLFQDEGVQNMLKSMSDESVTVLEGSSSESSVHKLRPKRPTEPMLASSPELDGVVDALFSNTKRRKRWSEVDTLYMDEGVLNLLTSIDPHSRRAGQDDAASDISQASSVRSVKTNKSSKSSVDISESRKRKLSGASTVSNTSTKSMQPPESKKICLEQGPNSQDPYDYNPAEEVSTLKTNEESSVEPEEVISLVPKKKGRPALPLSVKQKNKAIRMQLKIQKQKQMEGVSNGADQPEKNTKNDEDLQEVSTKNKSLESEEDSVNLAELQDTLRKEKTGMFSKVDAQLSGNLEKDEHLQDESKKNEKAEAEEDSVNLAELQDTLRKEKSVTCSNVEEPQTKIEQSVKAIPPLKIKLASDSVTISHVSKPYPKKSSSPIVQLPKIHHEPQLQQPQSKSRPHPVPSVVSGTSVFHLADIRELPRPSTSTAGVYPVPQQKRMETIVTPSSAGLPSLVRSYELSGQGRGRARVGETLRQSQRASVRQSEANNHYRDIALRKFNNFTQIIMSPSTTKMKNSLNSRVLRELCEALNILKRDETVRMVLLTATGPTFCQGVDLTALQHPNLDTRKKNAENLVRGIKEFLRTLVQFPKPIVAGVNGNAMGLGVTMLPLFDLVIVNDKAEFYLPYAKLGQIPEGGATYTFPNLFGKLKSMQLFLGHKVTASMALEMGLASESIWPATYQQELIPKVALLATQSAQSMEATKALMNHHLITKLELSLESECRLLLQHWTSPHFALLCKRFLDSHHIHLQKPVNLPL